MVRCPEKLETIKSEAFCRCEELIQLEIPFGVNNPGNNAFADCKNLQQIIITSTEIVRFENGVVSSIERSMCKNVNE